MKLSHIMLGAVLAANAGACDKGNVKSCATTCSKLKESFINSSKLNTTLVFENQCNDDREVLIKTADIKRQIIKVCGNEGADIDSYEQAITSIKYEMSQHGCLPKEEAKSAQK